MASLHIPLKSKLLWTTGDVLIRAEADLWLQARDGTWTLETFRVDTGTEMTMMPANLARRIKLPMPGRPIAGGVVIAGVRREVRVGILRARFVGLEAFDLNIPCHFVGEPEELDSKHPTLLGLSGVVHQVRLTFDGTASEEFPNGYLAIEPIERSDRS
jgi:hypothetical protein